MDIVILDLEWNGSYSRKKKGYINEIIEFGAVRCGSDLREIDSFSCLVRPQIAKRLNTVITNLTHITDESLRTGIPFMRAVSLFRRWAKDAVIMTWSSSDILALTENCEYFSGDPHIPFLQKYCNLQEYVQSALATGTSEQLGLFPAAELLGVDTGSSNHHRALDDSKTAMDILRKIYDPQALKPFIQNCDQSFYDRITFKTSYISDIHDPHVRHSHLRFTCPKCHSKARRITDWNYRNKGFRAEFECDKCDYSFAGRIILKLKYEGLIVNRKTFPLPVIEKPRAALPGKVGSMELDIAENGVGYLRFPFLSKIPGISHAFSTRIGGVSRHEYAAMNLSLNSGDLRENAEENYRLLAAALNLSAERLVAGAQDHQTNIRRVGSEQAGIGIWRERDMESVDGLCTDETELPLVIYCADCVPLYFYDPIHRAIGLAHAGWKGTAAGIAAEMVSKMQAEFGSDPKSLIAAIGPSICGECFEVDLPVAEIFSLLHGAEHFVREGENDKFHVDLWGCNRQFLLDAGVTAENIHSSGICSMENSDLIFSHRKTRGHRGGNAAVLCLTEE